MTDNPEPQFQYPQQWVPQPPPVAPQPGVLPLRPVDLGELIGGAFKAMFRNWLPMVLLPFIAYLIVGGVQAVLLVSAWNAFPDIPAGQPTFDHIWPFLRGMLVFGLVSAVVGVVAWLVTQVVGTVTVSRAVLGRTTTIGQALRVGGRRILPLLGLEVLVWLIVWACAAVPFFVLLVLAAAARAPGLILLAILVGLAGLCFGVYYWVRFSLAQYALILEPQPVTTALRRSSWLVRGNWWRVFGILLLVSLMVSVVSYFVQYPIGLTSAISNSYVADPTSRANAGELLRNALTPTTLLLYVFATAAVQAVGGPFVTGVAALLYHDLRIRKESFHLPLYEMSLLPDDLSPQPTVYPEATA